MTSIMSGAYSENQFISSFTPDIIELKHDLTPEVNAIQNNSDFDKLEKDWRRLQHAVVNCSSPMKWEWMREWWRVFENNRKMRLEILTVSIGGMITAILPLYYHNENFFVARSLRFLSTGEKSGETTSPDYLDLLYEPRYLLNSLGPLFNYIFTKALRDWDQIAFGILQQNSPLLAFANDSLGRKIRLAMRENNHVSMQAKIEGSFSSYLDSHSSSTKQFLKRVLKQSNSHTSFEVAVGPDQSLLFFNQMAEIHQRRWRSAGMHGAFGSPRIIDFHRSIISKLAKGNEVILTRLCYKGRVCAVLYGFKNGKKYEFYQSGIDILQKDIKSPGILAHLLNMKYLSERDVTNYDFLCGESGYKERLSNSKIQLKEVKIIKKNLRSANSAVAGISGRIAQKFINSLK